MRSLCKKGLMGFAGAALLAGGLPAQGGDLLSVDFTTVGNLSIQALQERFQVQIDNYLGPPNEATKFKCLRLGGNPEGVPSLRFPFGKKVPKGSLKIALGTSNSYSDARIKLLSGPKELLRLTVNPKELQLATGEQVKYPADVATVNRANKENRLVATFAWNVRPGDAKGTVSCSLAQPEKHGDAAVNVVKEEQFAVYGVPDTLLIELPAHDISSRNIEIFQINVTED